MSIKLKMTVVCPSCLGSMESCSFCSGTGSKPNPNTGTRICVKDQVRWDRFVALASSDEKGRKVLAFVQRWATEAQILMDAGISSKRAVDAALFTAQIGDELSAADFKKSVKVLLKHWTFADTLRSWDPHIIALVNYEA